MPELPKPFADLRWKRIPPVLLGHPVPLKIGIHADFLDMLEPGQERELSKAFGRYTSSNGYLAALLNDQPRFRYDADGNVTGNVCDNSRMAAAAKVQMKLARDKAVPKPSPAGPNGAKERQAVQVKPQMLTANQDRPKLGLRR